MPIDISHLDEQQLRDLIQQASDRIALLNRERLEKVQTQIIELSQSVGMTPEEVVMEMHKSRRRSSSSSSKAIYANPDEPSQTWSGMGRHPKWLKDKLAAGAQLSDFLV